jgi:exopolysaccharide production protein ExoY
VNQTTPLRPWPGKRLLDVTVSLILLVVLVPLFVALVVAVKASSPGPVLFRHQRVGRGGRTFDVLKFRTMECGAEERLASNPRLRALYVSGDYKLSNQCDPRVTGLGRVLRASSLDELPQLFNVLVGDMSLVGPRPVVPGELPLYGEHDAAYLALRPGVTGLWQVSGRNVIRFPQRAEIDADYRRRCSAALDLKILASTPIAVLTRRGVK